MLAIHGLGCSADQGWPRVQRAPPGLTVARMHGADGPATLPSSEWGILAQARRIVRERPGRADVPVGHSMGGTLATRVAEMDAFLTKMSSVDTGEGGYDHWTKRWDWRVFRAMSVDLAEGDGGERSWLDAVASFQAEHDFPITLVWGQKSGPPEDDLHAAALLKIGVPVMEGTSHWVPSEVPDALATPIRSATSQAR